MKNLFDPNATPQETRENWEAVAAAMQPRLMNQEVEIMRLGAENARLRNWLRVVAFHGVKARMQDGGCPWHDDNCQTFLQAVAEDALNGKSLDPKLVERLPDPKG